MKNKLISLAFLKISFYLLLVGIVLTGNIANNTGAWFTSNLTNANNEAEAAILDLTLRSGQNNFVPTSVVADMLPGQSAARDIYVGKTSDSMDLRHKVSYEYVSGDEDFCNQLQLKIWYNHYHCDPLGGYACRDMRLKYNSSLSVLTDFTDLDDFVIPHSDDLFDQNPSDGTEQWFYYQVTLPVGVAEIYQNKTCEFNFVYQSWQENSDGTWGFMDKEIIEGSEISSADWIAPIVTIDSLLPNPTNVDPTLIATAIDGYSSISQMYYDVLDSGSTVVRDNVSMTAQLPPFDSFTETAEADINITGLTDGIYTIYVYALDSAGNEGVSASSSLTIDNSSQITTFYTSNSPERQIKDDVLNGDFDGDSGMGGLDHWTSTGNVTVLETDDVDGIIDPNDIYGTVDNNHMAKIMPSAVPDGDLYYSSITQPISNSAKTLSFWYNFATYDSVGSDDPGFSVFINEKEVFQIWAEDINYLGGDLIVSDWQKFYYDLNSFDMGEHPILTLVFYAGNKYDDLFDSWVYLDKISTNDVYVSADTSLYLRTTTSLTSVNTYFIKGPCDSEVEGTPYVYGDDGFKLTEETNGNKFCYWSEGGAGNGEDQHEVNLIFDNDPPDSIRDLVIYDWDDGEFILDWTAVDPEDPTGNDTAAYYLLKYSEDGVINAANFDTKADYPTDAPRPALEEEELIVTGLSPGVEYYFALKACDAASNCSNLIAVSVVSATSGEVDPDAGGTKEVIINEIMWMGSESSSNDEWVELYNTTDTAIDLEEWQIIKKRSDGTEQCMFTFPAGASIGGNSYLVVSEYDQDHSAINIACPGPNCLVVGEGHTNDRDFSLANSRLQIKLYDGYWVSPGVSLIDVADDGVGAPASGDYDSGTGIYHSMERNADWGNGADPTNWHSCDDLGSAVYWDVGLTGEHWGTPGEANMSEPRPSILPTPLLDSLGISLDNQLEASPSASPSPSPSVSPTPNPNPSPDPSISPSPSPEASLEPSPSPSTEE